MIEIIRGESRLIRISLINQSNLNPVLIKTLTLAKIELYQNFTTFATYTFPNPEFRLGLTTNAIDLEIKSDVSQYFNFGIVRAKLTLSQPAINFPANPFAVDCIDFDILKTVLRQSEDDILVESIVLKTSLDDILLNLSSSTLASSSVLLSSGRA
jgi:hypothetical protein